MATQYRCKNRGRRDAVEKLKTLNGIDYLEVASPDQRTLKVYFIQPLPGESNAIPGSPAPPLTKDNLLIEGGVRIKDVRVDAVSATVNVLTITANASGDFSTYRLRLVVSPTNLAPPPGFDPQLSSVDFSFKVECPSDFDCEAVPECPPPRLTEPEINYLAKDYASFRTLILNRLSVIMPDWRERNPADAQLALVELLAYTGDHLSYYQDAVATEAYLGTARRRTSVRRHARLLDYAVNDGCNARTWVFLEVLKGGDADGRILLAGTPLLTAGSDGRAVVPPADLRAALDRDPLAFETMHDLSMQSAHNRISFYTWTDSECCLQRGATRATLLNTPALSLRVGDVVLFEEVISPTTGLGADADPTHRHVVRLTSVTATSDPLDGTPVMEIAWDAADALPFPLCLSAVITDAGGAPQLTETGVARGNVVLADHGQTLPTESPVPHIVPGRGKYYPQLARNGVTFAVPYDDDIARQRPAAEALAQPPREALAVVNLTDGNEQWSVQRDLLGSDRFAPDLTVEMERDGSAHLRFGDDVLGKKPLPGSKFAVVYRVGSGRAGNLGAEALARVGTSFKGILQVRNPLAATGGTDPETMEQVRQFAPQAFRTQQRAVTEEDYAEMAQRHPEVQKAAARFRWTGSWYTVFVTIDRTGGRAVTADPGFVQSVRDFLEQYRIAGYDLEINGPVLVPLDIQLLVCVRAGHFQADVKQALLNKFSRQEFPGGGRGFFHPDNFTFGQPVYLSRIYEAAMEVDGVASVDVQWFKRWGKLANMEIENGVLTPAPLEIIQLDNDPNFPENGKIDFDMHGAL
jgi:hypothetical protein